MSPSRCVWWTSAMGAGGRHRHPRSTRGAARWASTNETAASERVRGHSLSKSFRAEGGILALRTEGPASRPDTKDSSPAPALRAGSARNDRLSVQAHLARADALLEL